MHAPGMLEPRASQPIPRPRLAEPVDEPRSGGNAGWLRELVDAVITSYTNVFCIPVPPSRDPVRR
jgi:hypothetical protein